MKAQVERIDEDIADLHKRITRQEGIIKEADEDYEYGRHYYWNEWRKSCKSSWLEKWQRKMQDADQRKQHAQDDIKRTEKQIKDTKEAKKEAQHHLDYKEMMKVFNSEHQAYVRSYLGYPVNYDKLDKEEKKLIDHSLQVSVDIETNYQDFLEAQKANYQAFSIIVMATAAILTPLHMPQLTQFVDSSVAFVHALQNIEQIEYAINSFRTYDKLICYSE